MPLLALGLHFENRCSRWLPASQISPCCTLVWCFPNSSPWHTRFPKLCPPSYHLPILVHISYFYLLVHFGSSKKFILKREPSELPGGAVVETLHFQCQAHIDPWLRTKPTCCAGQPKLKKNKWGGGTFYDQHVQRT